MRSRTSWLQTLISLNPSCCPKPFRMGSGATDVSENLCQPLQRPTSIHDDPSHYPLLSVPCLTALEGLALRPVVGQYERPVPPCVSKLSTRALHDQACRRRQSSPTEYRVFLVVALGRAPLGGLRPGAHMRFLIHLTTVADRWPRYFSRSTLDS